MNPRQFHAIAFSGSLRDESTNTALVLLAQRLAPPELQITVIDWVDQLPWVNPDLEADPPEVLQRWWQQLRSADALLVGMPEHNAHPTALAKNALDWATRPPQDRAIAGKVVAFLSAAGRSGGANAQATFARVLQHYGAVVVDEPRVQLSHIAGRIAADGTTDDEEIVEAVNAKLRAVLAALTAHNETLVL
ncbi:MAG: NAD(P)H-dependent oxidoreductase [Actinomycetota bacterium]|nr:NAD(P)H-dependent oxidoreductase [Actinomycetota bacterium]